MVFKSLFIYWSNTTDTPSIQSTLNMFFYINVRVFKIKLNNYINFAITSLSSLKFKQIKIYYNLFNFKFLYYRYIILFLYTCMLIYI